MKLVHRVALLGVLLVSSSSALSGQLGIAITIDTGGLGKGGPIGTVHAFQTEDRCKAWSNRMKHVSSSDVQEDFAWRYECRDARKPGRDDDAVGLEVARGYWVERNISEVFVLRSTYFETIDDCMARFLYPDNSPRERFLRLGIDMEERFQEGGFHVKNLFGTCHALNAR